MLQKPEIGAESYEALEAFLLLTPLSLQVVFSGSQLSALNFGSCGMKQLGVLLLLPGWDVS